MRTFFWRVSAAIVLAAAILGTAHAQSDTAYLVTYIELMPNAVASGADLIKQYRDDSRKESGNVRFDALAEIKRPNRFAVIEVWKDKAALDAHSRSAVGVNFLEKLKSLQDAPNDVRVDRALYLGRSTDRRNAAIYVVTHIDVIPPGKEACMAALKAMSAATASDPGNIGYDVLQQGDHANHFTVVEEWTDVKAVNAHAMAMHTRAFREKLMPIKGALYDERFYSALN